MGSGEEWVLKKLPSGMDGFDAISEGGVPEGRVTLIAGTAGSGKTIFACQFLAAGIESHDQDGVFITFEDPAEAVRQNVRSFSTRSFREFVINLTGSIKHEEITGLFTATTATLTGGSSITEQHISTLADSVILLRYVESFGRVRRGLVVLKMRGSEHDREIREYTITGNGLQIADRLDDIHGLLLGNQPHVGPALSRTARSREPEGLRS